MDNRITYTNWGKTYDLDLVRATYTNNGNLAVVHLRLVVMISALAVAVRNTKTVVEEQQANCRSEASFSHVIQAQSLEVH